jgi:hypothetical protein
MWRMWGEGEDVGVSVCRRGVNVGECGFECVWNGLNVVERGSECEGFGGNVVEYVGMWG